MILTSLKLNNFRIHKKLELQFKQGVTGIVGRNGKGKSSIIEAIQFLITGDLFGTKESAINVNASTGSVSGTFLLNGKEVSIERHLHETKAILKYDGKTYKKSSEIAELWSSLIKINPILFKNVICAHQGEIPLLFDGDQAVREKIFQKVFLVPNTIKVRDTIWNKYIKTAPPEQHTESIDALKSELSVVHASRDRVNEELTRLSKLLQTFDEVAIQVRLQKVKAIVEARRTFPDLMDDIAKATPAYQANETAIRELRAKLDVIPINDFMNVRATLAANQKLWQEKEQLVPRLAAAQAEYDSRHEDVIDPSLDSLNDIAEAITSTSNKIAVIDSELAQLQSTANKYKAFDGKATCPTCGGEIHNLLELKQHTDNEIKLKSAESRALRENLKIDQARLSDVQRIHKAFETADHNLKLVQSAIDRYKALPPVGDLAQYDEAIATYNQKCSELKEMIEEQAELQTKLNDLQKYQAQVDYSSDTYKTPGEELEALNTTLKYVYDLKNGISSENNKLQSAEVFIKHLESRIKQSEEAEVYNAKRSNYINKLTTIYEGLHTNEFPRKLIQSYAGTVEEHLSSYLQRFSIPYTATITSNFSVDILDATGKRVDRASGGQRMIVGLCLRLALHSMFGTNFPFAIFDEGTTHLDSDNRELYFDLIRDLKTDSHLKQLLIIDHDPALQDAVDNVIDLG